MRIKLFVFGIISLLFSAICFYLLGLTLGFRYEYGFIYLRIAQVLLIALMGMFAAAGIYQIVTSLTSDGEQR